EGLGETFYFPASMSLVSDYHSQRTRSRAMSLHQTSVYAGTIGGAWFAGWMAEVWNWRYPFVVLGAGGVVLGLVLAAFIREPKRNEAELREQPERALSEPVDAPSMRIDQGDWLRYVTSTLVETVSFAWALVRIPSAL